MTNALPDAAGEYAFVSGAGSGIGQAVAIALARAGWPVVLADRDTSGVNTTAEAIRANGGRANPLVVDVTDRAALEQGVARADRLLGTLRAAFNGAGVEGPLAPVHEISAEDWDRTLAVNLTGTWNCMRLQTPRMLAGGGGSIVNCASVFGLVGSRGGGAYAASKHAIVGLSRSAALEGAAAGVRVNVICPGPADTPMIDRLDGEHPGFRERVLAASPGGRLIPTEQIAETVAWLCGPAATAVTGQAIAIDDGFTAG